MFLDVLILLEQHWTRKILDQRLQEAPDKIVQEKELFNVVLIV